MTVITIWKQMNLNQIVFQSDSKRIRQSYWKINGFKVNGK